MLNLDHLYKRHVDTFTGAQRYAQEQGWESIVDEYIDDTLSTRTAKTIPYDGIIARVTDELAQQVRRLDLPTVNIWMSSPAWNSLPGVFPDWPSIGQLQAEHLLTRGFRNFSGLILNNDRSQSILIKEFLSTVNKAGCPCIIEEIDLSSSATIKKWRISEQVITAWMDQWKLPIGVYVGSEADGRRVAQMCRSRGWRVPQDVAILAGHNEEAICEHLRPTLSSIEIGYDRIGYEAARLLDRLMSGEAPPKKPIILPPQGIVVRESTDFVAVDNLLIASALTFITTNYHLEIGADDVARSVNTLTRTLQRHFRRYLGRPIATEIRNVRIDRAKSDLTQTNHPLTKIAKDAGFGSATRMCEIFQREVGISPKKYRQERNG
jgi:LacI family transcriptional regulator